MTSKELIALLRQDGWILRGSKGSHHVFVHPSKAGHLTVPHPKKLYQNAAGGVGVALPYVCTVCGAPVLPATASLCDAHFDRASKKRSWHRTSKKDPEAGWIEVRKTP